MKLLLDQGLARSTALLLCEDGHDAVHIGEVGYSRAADSEIMELARQQGRVVLTLDADFHALLALSGAVSPSVLRLRIQGLNGEATAELLREVLAQCDEDLQQGAVVTVQEGRIRIRRLPLAPPAG